MPETNDTKTKSEPTISKFELPTHMKEAILPPLHTRLGLGNKLFEITYRNVGKLRFTAEFVGELDAGDPNAATGPAAGVAKSDTIATRDKLIVSPEEAVREALRKQVEGVQPNMEDDGLIII